MAGNRKRPATDFTGRQAEILAEKNAAEIAARAQQVSMVTAAAVAASHEVVDYSGSEVTVDFDDEGNPVEVEARRPSRKIRVNQTVEQLTYGHGNHYDFEEGREYVVPSDFANYLEEKGLVWH